MSESADRGGGKVVRLRLNTLAEARASYARLLRLRAASRIESALFRDLAYGLSGLLQYWRTEADIRLEEKLTELEARLGVAK